MDESYSRLDFVFAFTIQYVSIIVGKFLVQLSSWSEKNRLFFKSIERNGHLSKMLCLRLKSRFLNQPPRRLNHFLLVPVPFFLPLTKNHIYITFSKITLNNIEGRIFFSSVSVLYFPDGLFRIRKVRMSMQLWHTLHFSKAAEDTNTLLILN